MTQNVAILSLHTSPLTQPGVGDSGGMNVYVREMAAALAHSGSECRVYVRRARGGLPDEVDIEPGVTVVHINAGPVELNKEDLPGVVEEFADGVLADFRRHRRPDVIHANYWLSGVAGHRVKHAVSTAGRDLPHAGPGKGGHWRSRVGAPGPGRDRGDRLCRCGDCLL